MSILLWILFMTIINGFLAIAGAFINIIFKKNINKFLILFVSFTTGTLMGGALFHFIPESLEEFSLLKTTVISVIGFFSFLSLEKFLHWHHCHNNKCDVHEFNYLLLWGDAIHNFVDGLIIASSFIISIPFGIISSLLIMLHELPQEIGDFGVLIYGGFSKKKALFYNLLSQLTAVFGGLLGYYFFQFENISTYLLPFTAGGFIYIAIADLIPEILKEKNKKKIILNIIFILLGIGLLISSKLIAK